MGIRGGDERWAEAADASGLAVYPAERDAAARRHERREEDAGLAPSSGDADSDDGAEVPVASGGGVVVTQPVRSGQQIYARGSDLVLLAPVSPGAEVLADGHIHVYSTLNGRALAGVHGDTAARIFCKRFRAELVSVAGIYSVSEQFDESLSGKPVQISLQDGSLHTERL